MKKIIYFLVLLPLIVFGKPATNFITSNKSIKFATSFLSTSPIYIKGTTSVCKGSGTSLTAVGATLVSGDVYQWGTGTTIGLNVISGQSAASLAVVPSETTSYWVRVVSTSGSATNGVSITVTVVVANVSTAPTGITAPAAICNGTSTLLSATGAILSSGAVYQWGMGTVIGSNVIANQTTATITVTPTGTATYWVRVLDAAPCNNITSGVITVISLVKPSLAPTTITGLTTVCLGSATTLTVSGGYGATGSTYQWGTGTVIGSNIITGQTLSSLTVAPTTNTNYWVRRIDNASCNSSTDAISIVVNVNIPEGDQVTYGNNSWIGYVYSGYNTTVAPVVEDVFASNYRGYLTENENFDKNYPSCVISGENICGTYNVKYAVRFKMAKDFTPGYYNFLIGGDDGVRLSIDGGATYLINEWRVQAYTTAKASVYLSGNTNLVLEYFQGPLSNARVSFACTPCGFSEAPTAITGNITSCTGAATTLTAKGGFEFIDSTYQWGTGSIVGTNIITGQTLSSITVSPINTTTYWVRRISAAPCSFVSSGISTTVTTTPKSTAPTWLSGVISGCLGFSTTLTANGGTVVSGCTYQWGTGSVLGFNIISGQTAQNITVTPTGTTTYWVRRLDNGVCSSYTNGISTLVTVSNPSGNPAIFGDNQWNVYGYSTGDITLATALYSGNYTLDSLDFDTQKGTNSWLYSTSPSSAAGWVGCTVPNDNFTYVLKRKGFACGNYTLKLLNWDDEAGVFINGIQVWSASDWSGAASSAIGAVIGTFDLDSNSTIEVRVREYYGNSNASLTFINHSKFEPSSAPTAIIGTTIICNGTSTRLTAIGGVTSTSGLYQWGTGSTVGSNIISGQNAASITVSPTSDTVYWARRTDSICNNVTDGVTQTVSIIATIGGTISESDVVSSGSDLVLVVADYVGNIIKWQSSTSSDFSSDVSDIAITTPSLALLNLEMTTYYRAVVQNGNCSLAYSSIEEVPYEDYLTDPTTTTDENSKGAAPLENYSTAPTSITGTTVVCKGTRTTLTAIGGVLSPTGSYQWGIGSTVGSNIIIGQIEESITINLFLNTIYWVRRVDSDLENSTSGVTQLVSVTIPTVGGSTSAKQDICAGTGVSDIVLTGNVGTVVKWQKSNEATFATSTDILTTSTRLSSSTIGLLYKETYFRAVVSNGDCSSAFSSVSRIVVAPVSFGGIMNRSGRICYGSNTTLILSNRVGSILKWQSSTTSDFSSNVSDIANTTQSLKTPSLITTTFYRAVVQNGTCAAVYSPLGTVVVDPITVGGTIDENINVCSGSSATLTLSGKTGSIIKWQSSTVADFSSNVSDIANMTPSLTTPSLTTTTYYRALVQSGACSLVYSSIATVTVYSLAVGGSITGSKNYSETAVSATVLTLIGKTGNVIKWQSAVHADFSGTITDVVNTTVTLVAPKISTTTYYRAVVQSGVCSSVYSSIGAIVISAVMVKDSQCGTTLVNLDSSIYPNPILGAQAFKFQVTQGSNVRVYEPTTLLFNLTQLPGSATYNTTYSVQIAVKLNDVWSAFGSPCNITTPSPITKVKSAYCGATLATIITSVYADALIGVQGYRFEVTDPINNVKTFDAAKNLFNLTQLTGGATYGTTYRVRVAVNVNGVWGAYGASCNVITPVKTITRQASKQVTKQEVEPVSTVTIKEYTVKAYPNPFTDNFKLLLTSASEETVDVAIYDMLGRMITNKVVKPADIKTVELGDEFSAGVYNVIIRQGTDVSKIRMIKR